jgi:hypothetical protein
MHTHPEKSVAELMHELLSDARTLVRQEIALARAEFREQLNHVATVGALSVAAAVVLAAAGLWILIAVTLGLAALFHWPLWGVYLGVGIALAAIGCVLAAVIVYQARAIAMLPKTRDSLRKHAQWSIAQTVDKPSLSRRHS